MIGRHKWVVVKEATDKILGKYKRYRCQKCGSEIYYFGERPSNDLEVLKTFPRKCEKKMQKEIHTKKSNRGVKK